MVRQLNRATPALDVRAYKTYQVVAPLATHYRAATCAEYGCQAYENGWVTRVTRGSEAEQYLLNVDHGRKYNETTGLESAEREFMFSPGQQCFRSSTHRVPLEREPLYIVKGGDWRGNPTRQRRQHARSQDWVEDFATHQSALADTIEKG
jgi:hypothetical protein